MSSVRSEYSKMAPCALPKIVLQIAFRGASAASGN